ncbi:MAG: nuclear transport factor 2 family protein [Wenzhouxiangellaceae bacterium]
MQKIIPTIIILALGVAGAAPSLAQTADDDRQALVAIIEAIEHGWEDADGAPFRQHYLDVEGARYVESGGQNEGLTDLIEHHVEPEGDALSDFALDLNRIEIHLEGNFAWAIADVEFTATMKQDGRQIHNRGHETFLFRRVGSDWKVVHTHSSSRPVNRD